MNKPEFSLRSYGKLVREINRDPSILEHDWREVLESAFELKADQRESISSLTDSVVRSTQESFNSALQYVRNGGKLRTRIQTKDDGGHELIFLIDDIPSLMSPQGIRIVCCDADCGNW